MKAETKLSVFNISGALDLLETVEMLGYTSDKLIETKLMLQDLLQEFISNHTEKEIKQLVKAAGEYQYEVRRKRIGHPNQFSVVNVATQSEIINELIKYKCLGCDMTKQQAKNCWFRKAIEEEGYEAITDSFHAIPTCITVPRYTLLLRHRK